MAIRGGAILRGSWWGDEQTLLSDCFAIVFVRYM